jgi:excisionase family DNA binding protein
MNDQLVLSPIPRTELVGDIAKAVRDMIAAQPTANPSIPEELLTRVEAAHLLGITLPTLREYTRRGIVKGYRLGARVRYKRSEVLGGLAPMATRKPVRP